MAMIMCGACTRKIIEIMRSPQLPHPLANTINTNRPFFGKKDNSLRHNTFGGVE
jgi:hypothetical protein